MPLQLTLPLVVRSDYEWYTAQRWIDNPPTVEPWLGHYISRQPTTVINGHPLMWWRAYWCWYSRVSISFQGWWGVGQEFETDEAIRANYDYMEQNAAADGAWTGLGLGILYELDAAPDNPTIATATAHTEYLYDTFMNRANYPWVQNANGVWCPVMWVYRRTGSGHDPFRDKWIAVKQAMVAQGKPIYLILGHYANDMVGDPDGIDAWMPYSTAYPSWPAPDPDDLARHSDASQVGGVPGGFTVCPGFWKYSEATPRLNRHDDYWAVLMAYTATLITNATVGWINVTSGTEWIEGTGGDPNDQEGTVIDDDGNVFVQGAAIQAMNDFLPPFPPIIAARRPWRTNFFNRGPRDYSLGVTQPRYSGKSRFRRGGGS